MLQPSHHTLDTIWGHEVTRQLVVRLLEQQRLPHALLLSGADGVGKRSLAFALAKTILSAGLRKRSSMTGGAPGLPPREASLKSPVRGAMLRAPAPPKMIVRVGAGPALASAANVFHAPEDDLFGGMDDLFAEPPKPAPKPKAKTKDKSAGEAPPTAPPAEPESAAEPESEKAGKSRKNNRADAETQAALAERTPLPRLIAPGNVDGAADDTLVPIAAPPPVPVSSANQPAAEARPVDPPSGDDADGASLFRDDEDMEHERVAAPPPVFDGPIDTSLDDRVHKLVSKAYPVEYNNDERPMLQGHVDLMIIEPIGKSKSIKIDQVRVMQDTAMLPPLEGRFRVILVFGADTITMGAANSLLKLMEEPPSWLVLILVTDHYHRVLETIRSRCASLVCAALPKDDLVDKLVQQERVEPGLARVAASIAEGRPGRALELVAGKALKARHEVFEARLNIDRVGAAAMPLACARALSATGSLGAAALMLMALARDRLVKQLAPEDPGLLINGDLAALYDGLPVDEALLHEEAERLLEALTMEDHPAVPAPMVPLQMALWG